MRLNKQYQEWTKHENKDERGISSTVPDQAIGNNKQVVESDMKRSDVPTFPVKLHFMLTEMENDGLSDIVGWQPDGRSFIIKTPKEFESKIIPWYVNHNLIR